MTYRTFHHVKSVIIELVENIFRNGIERYRGIYVCPEFMPFRASELFFDVNHLTTSTRRRII
jgi:hypothetical protein